MADMVDTFESCALRERARTHRAKRTTLSQRANIPQKGSILAITCYNPRIDPERRCETIAIAIKKYGYVATLRALVNALHQAERVFSLDARIVATLRADIEQVCKCS